jgi:hypothetical protein
MQAAGSLLNAALIKPQKIIRGGIRPDFLFRRPVIKGHRSVIML